MNLESHIIGHVYKIDSSFGETIVTKNLVLGETVYGERIIKNGEEYRVWNPNRSKLSAVIHKGYFPDINKQSRVLYLGAASGTTASHISDIITEGIMYAVEFSQKPMLNLIKVCKHRKNIIPIFSDAARPNKYEIIVDCVDIIYQDVAQKDQVGIALKNSKLFLKKNGILILMLKARSVSSTTKPKDVIRAEVKKLREEFDIIKSINLMPYHKDHVAIVGRFEGQKVKKE